MREFTDLPKNHPLRKKRPARPYQRADIAMMAMASCMNCNDVGTGKTLEAVGAIHEAQLNPKPVLLIAPRRTLVNVWQAEFERLSEYRVMTSESPAKRREYMELFLEDIYESNLKIPLVLGLIADDLRLDKYKSKSDTEVIEEDPLHACRDYQGNWYRYRDELQAALFGVEYGAFIIDEFHTTGLNNRTTLFYNSASQINAERRWPMSGTPMGGKPRRLWSVLNFLDKKQYSSEWRWIEDWLEVTEETFYKKGDRRGHPTGKARHVGGLDPNKEGDFYEHHAIHMTRRTKRDALPGLPPMVELLIDTPMTDDQAEEYDRFDDEHEIVLNGKRLSGSIVLSQYTRLRQMASFRMMHDGKKWVATEHGGKFQPLIDALDDNGIRRRDWEPAARAYVGVLDVSFAEVTVKILRERGIECDTLTGGTKDSKPLIRRFNDGSDKPYVIVMTVQTGGSGLNLESANSAHLLDEPWDPDQQYQFFGRGDRGSRTTPLRCYTYRTPNSIQEYIAAVAGEKKITNNNVLRFAPQIEALRR
jgi:SNF2 family DNA or RNA helicase